MAARQTQNSGDTTVDSLLTKRKDGKMPDDTPKVELKKRITLFHCVSIIVGIIIGAGIFVSPVGITVQVRSVGMSILMWFVVGVFNTLCALCFAELGACLPESGGEYIYIKRAWGDFPAFLCLWMNYLLITPVTAAASSLVFANYMLRPLFPDCEPPRDGIQLLAALIIALLVAINCHNVNWVTKLQAVITGSKLLALMMVIVIGFIWLGKGNTENFQGSFEGTDLSAGAIAFAFYSGSWAFGGWNYLSFLTEEVVDPHRNLPLGIMISMGIITAVYMLANVAYFAVLTPAEMLQSSAVAVTFLQRTVPGLAYVIPFLIALSVVGALNGGILSVSRLFYVAARNNHLPSIVSMITIKKSTPVPSLVSLLILVVIMQTFGNIFFLIEMMGFSLSIVLIMTFAGQVLLRWTEPGLLRPIKVPVVLPAVLIVFNVAIMCITVYQKPQESSIALVIIACGVPAYLLGTKKDKPKSVQRFIENFTETLQKLLIVTVQDSEDCEDGKDTGSIS
ncbi:hypothetical protein EGW08_012950 [Elysia chlorotica]|uniref:Amino acid permease/ SLC12A domain-containing protein n=1 Tax=Elysia chlorotica TaxID=188477 RepID=A0A3S1B3Z0_ELYCH|nr:hypothetical protein EGW08_012950 [Elysia chlorotica]